MTSKFWRSQVQCRWNEPENRMAGFFVSGMPYDTDIIISYDHIPEYIIKILVPDKILHAEYDFHGNFRNWEDK